MKKENYDIWFEGVKILDYPKTVLPNQVDILIVGGGITGVTSTYLLAKAGKKPLLLDKRKLGDNVTDCTTGFLSQVIDTDPDKLISLYGPKKAKMIYGSHKDAIDNIEKIIISEEIDCEFKRCSNYIYANNQREEKILIKMTGYYKMLGVDAEYKKDSEIKFNNFGYIELFNQAKFNAIKYLASIAQIAAKNGATIMEHTKVLNLIDKKDTVLVDVENVGIINAKVVLSAVYVPFGKPEYLEHKYNMYRSYVVEYKIPTNTLLEATYQDTLKPYHYFRIDKKNGFDRLVIGGNDNLNILKIDHEIGAKIMRDYTNKLFGDDNFEEVRHWSGLISEPVNGLALIGQSMGGNIFYTFGFSGNGLTYSYIASKIFTNQLIGQNNPYAKIYSTDNKLPWWKDIF